MSLLFIFYVFKDNLLAKLEASKKKSTSSAYSTTVRPQPKSPSSTSPPQSPSTSSPGQVVTNSADPVKSSESYKFSHTCGANIAVMCAGKKAKRIE